MKKNVIKILAAVNKALLHFSYKTSLKIKVKYYVGLIIIDNLIVPQKSLHYRKITSDMEKSSFHQDMSLICHHIL